MKFDDILKELGEFGFYQKRLYLLLCLPAISVGCFMMGGVVLLAVPEHRCKLPGYDNDTWEIQSSYHAELVNMTIPSSTHGHYKYDRCSLYTVNNILYDINNHPLNATRFACTEWVYDKNTFIETFTSQNNFVCDDAILASHAQMVFYVGVLVGDLIFGLLADIIGRKKTLCIGVVIMIASAFAVAWAPNFLAFTILEFIVGASCHGAFMSCAVLGLELVGPSKRVWTGILIHAFFAIGLCYLAGVSFLLRNWKYIQIAVAAPCVLYLSFWWLIPESPRWLLSRGRKDEAETIMRRAAKVNKTSLPEKLFDGDTIYHVKGGKLWQLFTSRVLFFRTVILFYNWVVVSMMYYGVTMYAGKLGGDFYLNFFLLALVEFPAKAISILCLDRIGRKWLQFAYMILGGSACLGTIFTVLYGGKELDPLTVALALIGKLGPAGAFGVIYVFSAELYPTLLRNAGMGASSCVARVGGMVAPYIAKSGDLVGGSFGNALPLTIFGAASISAGLLCLALPDTLNCKLPDTIEEARRFKGPQKNKKKREQATEVVVGSRNLPEVIKSTSLTNGLKS